MNMSFLLRKCNTLLNGLLVSEEIRQLVITNMQGNISAVERRAVFFFLV